MTESKTWMRHLFNIVFLQSNPSRSPTTSLMSLDEAAGSHPTSSPSPDPPGRPVLERRSVHVTEDRSSEASCPRSLEILLAEQEREFVAAIYSNISKVNVRSTRFEEALTTTRLALVDEQQELQKTFEGWEVARDTKYYNAKAERRMTFENAIARREEEFTRGMDLRNEYYATMEDEHDVEATEMNQRRETDITNLMNRFRRILGDVVNEEKELLDDLQKRWEQDVETMMKEFSCNIPCSEQVATERPTEVKFKFSNRDQMEGKLVFEDTDYQCNVDHRASPGAFTVTEATPRCASSLSPELSTLFVPYGSSHYSSPSAPPSCQPSVKSPSIILRVENNLSPTTSTSSDSCPSVSPTSEFIQVSSCSCSTPWRPCSYHSLSDPSKLSETISLFPISFPANPKQFHLQSENVDFQSHSEWKQMFDDAYEDRENIFVETEERLDQEGQGRIHRINQLCDGYERQFASLKDEFRKRFTFTDDARSEEEKRERENRSQEEGEDHRWFEFQTQTLMFEQRFKTKEDSRWWALRSLWRNEVDTGLRELEGSMLELMEVGDIERALERSLKHLGVQLLDKPRSQLQVNDSLFQSVGNGKEQDMAFYPNSFKVDDDNDPDNNDIGWICRESNPIAETLTTHSPSNESSNREDGVYGTNMITLEHEAFLSHSPSEPTSPWLLARRLQSSTSSLFKEAVSSEILSKRPEDDYNRWRDNVQVMFDSQIEKFRSQHETSENQRKEALDSALSCLTFQERALISSWKTQSTDLLCELDGMFAAGEKARNETFRLEEDKRDRDFLKGEEERSEQWRERILYSLQDDFRVGEMKRENEFYQRRLRLERMFMQKLNIWKQDMKDFRRNLDTIWEDATADVRAGLATRQSKDIDVV